jgi:hypothetical protein
MLVILKVHKHEIYFGLRSGFRMHLDHGSKSEARKARIKFPATMAGFFNIICWRHEEFLLPHEGLSRKSASYI